MMEGRNKTKNSFSVLSPDVAKFNPESVPLFTLPPRLALEVFLQLPETMPAQGTGEGERLTIGIANILPNRVPTGLPPDSRGRWGSGCGSQAALPSPGLPSLGLCLHLGLVS